jgi:hypothetical protein
MDQDRFTVDLRTEAGRLDYAQQLWSRFCEDLGDDPGKARTRLLSGIQIAVREALDGGHIDPLIYTKSAN